MIIFTALLSIRAVTKVLKY